MVPLQNFVEHRPGLINREAHPALHCFLDSKWLGLARIVLPGEPHHITQRGNRRLEVFRTESDRCRFIERLGAQIVSTGVRIGSYVLMTNHIHLIAVPPDEGNASFRN